MIAGEQFQFLVSLQFTEVPEVFAINPNPGSFFHLCGAGKFDTT